MSDSMFACDTCHYFHTAANGCPTPDMIARNFDGYDGTHEEEDVAAPMLTSEELLYGLNRVIWAIQESGRTEDAEAMRTIRDRSFDLKAMGMDN